MNEAIYAGSFDPVTYGHIDIIQRGIKMFGKVHVVVMVNRTKNSLFSFESRIEMIRESLGNLADKVEIEHYEGLLVDYCAKKNIYTVIRGLRALTDFDYEFQMALTNRMLNDKIESVLLVSRSRYSYLSSSVVKEIAFYGGDISRMVPDNVAKRLRKLYTKQ